MTAAPATQAERRSVPNSLLRVSASSEAPSPISLALEIERNEYSSLNSTVIFMPVNSEWLPSHLNPSHNVPRYDLFGPNFEGRLVGFTQSSVTYARLPGQTLPTSIKIILSQPLLDSRYGTYEFPRILWPGHTNRNSRGVPHRRSGLVESAPTMENTTPDLG